MAAEYMDADVQDELNAMKAKSTPRTSGECFASPKCENMRLILF